MFVPWTEFEITARPLLIEKFAIRIHGMFGYYMDAGNQSECPTWGCGPPIPAAGGNVRLCTDTGPV